MLRFDTYADTYADNLSAYVLKHRMLVLAVTHDGVLSRFAMPELLELLGGHPVPDDVAFPANLEHTGGPR